MKIYQQNATHIREREGDDNNAHAQVCIIIIHLSTCLDSFLFLWVQARERLLSGRRRRRTQNMLHSLNSRDIDDTIHIDNTLESVHPGFSFNLNSPALTHSPIHNTYTFFFFFSFCSLLYVYFHPIIILNQFYTISLICGNNLNHRAHILPNWLSKK